MRFGLFLPNFGAGFGEAAAVAELAREAEDAGWDGFFLWDHVARHLDVPVLDPWIGLSAVALATSRIRLGTLVTPLPRRRPWKLARETVSLDRLSGGRLTLGVGIGSGRAGEWDDLGEEVDPRVRGAMLDEGLEVLLGLWSGEPFAFEGAHYRVSQTRFLPTPLQRPRIPIWVAGYWPNRRPMRRAARYDGAFPLFREPGREAEQLAEAVAFLREEGVDDAVFDVVHCAPPLAPGARDARSVEPFRRAGATWWLERLTPEDFGGGWDAAGWPADAILERVRAGPPGT